MPQTALLLHGFAGTGRMWDPVVERLDAARYRAHAPDLRGHGANRARPVTLDAVVGDLRPLLAPAPALVCGYSMGGRVALHLALAAPDRIARLVLVATTAGLEAGREQRARQEAAAAERLEREDDIAAFAERWTTGPLFADDPPQARARQREDVLRNDPAGLAAALRGLGQSALPPLWDRLGELDMPVTVLAGARDPRYVAIAQRLAAAIPDARLVVVPGAGHGLPREAPDAVAAAIGAG